MSKKSTTYLLLLMARIIGLIIFFIIYIQCNTNNIEQSSSNCIKTFSLKASDGVAPPTLKLEMSLDDSVEKIIMMHQLDSFFINGNTFKELIHCRGYNYFNYNDTLNILKLNGALSCLGNLNQIQLDTIKNQVIQDIEFVLIDKNHRKYILYPCNK